MHGVIFTPRKNSYCILITLTYESYCFTPLDTLFSSHSCRYGFYFTGDQNKDSEGMKLFCLSWSLSLRNIVFLRVREIINFKY